MSDAQNPSLPSIESAFQPIFSLAHQEPVGYEALLRPSQAGELCSPAAAFATARRLGRCGEFERACVRHHIGRFLGFADSDNVLFLNVHPDMLVHPVHGPGLIDDIAACGLPPSRVVIEILEVADDTAAMLADAVARLRLAGFLIALDDFGAGLTNLGRVWDLRPDVVKLDGELIRKAVTSYRNARSLLRLIELLHDIGTFVVVEGIEAEAQALLSMDCDADFVQGYYFARPEIIAGGRHSALPVTEPLARRFMDARKLPQIGDMEELEPYRRAFRETIEAFIGGHSVEACAAHFLALEWSLRVFLLDDQGVQVCDTIEAQGHPMRREMPFPLLTRRTGANWAKRAYFRNALAHPGTLMVSEPYMSSSSTNLCVTLSIYIRTLHGGRVVGGDVLFEGLSRLLE
ncbi:EAL domain-containing protein [Trinickia terrae]|uniref:EAL domain-containing protein n=1 Tax=Trinickia terrae TaxID=2571161 RepID=A0A4U1I3L5_9BURK|nr:EAL domain-containing protein [Trinickia terrae]TKC87829.1 EAL domain-containing protein [Trinickia terrae]